MNHIIATSRKWYEKLPTVLGRLTNYAASSPEYPYACVVRSSGIYRYSRSGNQTTVGSDMLCSAQTGRQQI